MSFITVQERAEMVGKFFGVTKPENMSWEAWRDQLFDMEMKWEEENQKPFPL